MSEYDKLVAKHCEQDLTEEIANRDRFEKAFSDAYALVMGEAMEWSSNYNEPDALRDMELRLRRERAHKSEAK